KIMKFLNSKSINVIDSPKNINKVLVVYKRFGFSHSVIAPVNNQLHIFSRFNHMQSVNCSIFPSSPILNYKQAIIYLFINIKKGNIIVRNRNRES
ncbi:MAG: hypothetical protein ACFFG0_53250, partial [Candidatus Thorarchaeota archaeon]